MAIFAPLSGLSQHAVGLHLLAADGCLTVIFREMSRSGCR
jgi:hypothetical protein